MSSNLPIFTKILQFVNGLEWYILYRISPKSVKRIKDGTLFTHFSTVYMSLSRFSRNSRLLDNALWRTVPNFMKIRQMVLVADGRTLSPHKGFFYSFVRARNKLKWKANGSKENLRKIVRKIATLDIRVSHCPAGCGTVRSGVLVHWNWQ
jgi:hypothetical protein